MPGACGNAYLYPLPGLAVRPPRRQLNRPHRTRVRLLQRDRDRNHGAALERSLLRKAAVPCSPEVVEDAIEPTEGKFGLLRPGAARAVEPCKGGGPCVLALPYIVGIAPPVPESVVLLPGVRIGQHLVGLVDLLELGLGVLLPLVHVRVMFARETAVRGADILLGRSPVNSQRLVVVLRHDCPDAIIPRTATHNQI